MMSEICQANNECMEEMEHDELTAVQGGARECEQTSLGLMCRESKNDIWRLQ